MQHICAYKLAATYKMTLMYFLVNIHIDNQSTLYKVNGVPLILRKTKGAQECYTVRRFCCYSCKYSMMIRHSIL
jgi:hypothetical protein